MAPQPETRRGFFTDWNPLVHFAVLFLIHSFFSYGVFPDSLSFHHKIILEILVLVLSLVLLARFFPLQPLSKKGTLSFLTDLPWWAWLVPALIAVFLRFFRLTSFSPWPLFDESLFGFSALDLSRHGEGRWFYSLAQIPPLYIYGLSFLFRAGGVSLAALWFWPALLSTLSLPLVFLTARRLFPKNGVWLPTFLWAFGFWPLLEGRFGVEYPLFVFWELLTLYLWAVFLNSKTPGFRILSAVFFGLCVGTGFYIVLTWLVVAVTTGILFLAAVIEKGWPKKILVPAFFVPAFLVTLPLASAFHQSGHASYIQNSLDIGMGLPLSDLFLNPLSYLAGIFWGIPASLALGGYGPVSAGFLNPILGAFLFLGLTGFLDKQNRPSLFLPLLISAVCLSPAFLTKTLEFYRIIQILPFLFILVSKGIEIFLSGFPAPARPWILTTLLLLSSVLDITRLLGPQSRSAASPEVWKFKSIERMVAFQYAQVMNSKFGPGLVFTEFPEDSFDSSLMIATYPFNAALNPALSPEKAGWICLLADIRFQPYLKERFPDGRWYTLVLDKANQSHTWGIVPTKGQDRNTLEKWRRANEGFWGLSFQVLNHVEGESRQDILERLFGLYSLVQGDSILEGFYWTRLSKFLCSEVNERNAAWLSTIPVPHARNFDFLRIELATMYQKYGAAMARVKKYPQARLFFDRAASFGPEYGLPPALSRHLKNLLLTKKGERDPSPRKDPRPPTP